MSPRLVRHASMTACVFSLRMWAIVDAKGMTDRSVDMSEPGVKHATWSMQLTCLMQRLMYGRRGFVAGCGVIVLSQGRQKVIQKSMMMMLSTHLCKVRSLISEVTSV
ncbi:unnamed protein product [Prunus armeniaca]